MMLEHIFIAMVASGLSLIAAHRRWWPFAPPATKAPEQPIPHQLPHRTPATVETVVVNDLAIVVPSDPGDVMEMLREIEHERDKYMHALEAITVTESNGSVLAQSCISIAKQALGRK